MRNTAGKDYDPPQKSFVGIFVGCNKGLDAVNAMRMGTGNSKFDKFAWKDAMAQVGEKGALDRDVCNQATTPQFSLAGEDKENEGGDHYDSSSASLHSMHLHCIEPMQSTVRALARVAYELTYDKMGFVVTHAAMAKEDGSVLFPRGNKFKLGKENKGIASSNCDQGQRGKCTNVTMYSLDTYVNKFVPEGVPINYLSVDAEGHDYDVLLGGTIGGTADIRTNNTALSRVHYLEFEYNWMGPWKNQSFQHAIEYLDAEFQFTCYWDGFNNTIWRITECWLDHYDIHFWSNVACVNRNAEEVREVAENMERLF